MVQVLYRLYSDLLKKQKTAQFPQNCAVFIFRINIPNLHRSVIKIKVFRILLLKDMIDLFDHIIFAAHERQIFVLL